jgi:CheY-like chemotaxis protein
MARILIIDDDELVLELEKKLLTDGGHDILVATQALLALDILQLYSVDLIIVDIQMPRFNGFQFVTTIKNNPQLKHIPIAFLSSHSESEVVQQAVKLGADLYLVKPIERISFTEKIEQFFKKSPPSSHPIIKFEQAFPIDAKIHLSGHILEISDMGVKILIKQELQEEQLIELSSTTFHGILPENLLFKVLWAIPQEDDFYKAYLVFYNHNTDMVRKLQKYIQSKQIKPS